MGITTFTYTSIYLALLLPNSFIGSKHTRICKCESTYDVFNVGGRVANIFRGFKVKISAAVSGKISNV